MAEVDSILTTMKDFKREGECCCCFSNENLFNMLEPYNFEENVEIYSTMIAECFRIESSLFNEEFDRNLAFICHNCIFRLRDAIMLRSQVHTAYDRLQADVCKKNYRAGVSQENLNIDNAPNTPPTFYGAQNIKREEECCCCFSKEDLFNMLEAHNFEEKAEIYSNMVAECYQIELNSYIEECNKSLYLICKNCIFRLRDAIMLLSQIRIAYDRLQAEYMKNNQGVISSAEIAETKGHILKYDISECDNTECNLNVDSGASFSNENVFQFKPLNIDNNTIENVSIISTGELQNTSGGSKTFFCSICNKFFENLFSAQQHMKIHKKMNFNCEYCDKSYNRGENLIRHLRQNHCMNIEKVECDICKKRFTRKESLRNHIMLHMGLINIKCQICNRVLFSKAGLERHIQKCHSVALSCDKCNKSYGNENALRRHMQVHLKEKDWTCNICSKILTSKRAFDNHAIIHSGVKNQKCEICEKTFSTKATLRVHKRLHFNPSKQTCKYCNKPFKNLWRHEKTHSDIKGFTCDYCKRGFRLKINLQRHIKYHIGVKNIKCEVCGKFFVSKDSLWSHMRSHSISLPCKVCGVVVKKHSLTNHMKLHKAERLICDHCGGSFTRKAEVTRHILKRCKGITNKISCKINKHLKL